MKRYLPYLLITLLTLLSSCKNSSSRQEIEFWTLQLSPAFNNYFTSLISEYEASNPDVKIKWVDVPYDAAVRKLLASSAAGSVPDIINLSSDFLAKFSSMNFMADFSEYIPGDSLNIFLPNALKECIYNGRVIALPWYLNTYILIYNKKFLTEAGYSINDIPRSFDELIKFTREYKDRTGKFALFWNIGKDSYLPMMLGSEGIPMSDSGMTEAKFNSVEGIAHIDKWVQLYRDGYLQSESIIKPGSSIIEPYQSAQAAMVFTGPVFLKRIRENSPSVYSNTAVAPAVTGKTGMHELAVMTLSVHSGSKNIAGAVRFTRFVLNKTNQLEFSRLSTTYPSVTEALTDSFFIKRDGTLESEARVTGALELKDAVRLRKYLEHPQFDKLSSAFDEAVQNAALGKMSTKEALDKAAIKWNSILNKR
jgi:putative chitobiose transport system substrate-binding protein